MCALRKAKSDQIDRRVPPARLPLDAEEATLANPRAAVQRVVSEVRELARARGLAVWTDISSTTAPRGRFDEKTVVAVLRELLTHCLRVTPHGSVGALVCGRGPSQIVVEVIHSGPGIRVADFERLGYEPGHPLARARSLARRLGSELVYERSHRASGVYRFRFDVEPIADPSPGRRRWSTSTAPPLSGRILVVERDGEGRRLLRRQLEDLGVAVSVAENGMGAIDRALFESFDLVVIGLETPGLNAFGAARVLRRAGFDRPIVALANQASSELRDRIVESGFDGVLLRPLDRITLIDLASRYVPKRLRGCS
jgi:CheY-like chemotaxis protein